MENKNTNEVAIIGAGPIGLFAAFECGIMGLSSHIFDNLDYIGGQCNALYSQKPIYDIPAHPKILAADLIENLKQQIERYNPNYHLGKKVEKIIKLDNLFKIERENEKPTLVSAIIIAAGKGFFNPTKLPFDNIKNFEKKSILYKVEDKYAFKNKKVVITGGGDSAVDWAIELSKIGASVSIVHRRNKFRCALDSENTLKKMVEKGSIKMHIPYAIKGVIGEKDQISKVIINDLDGNKNEIEADYLLAFYGISSCLGPINDWGLNIDDSQIVVDPATCMSNVPGIFAIGDIAKYPGKLKLILSGFSEGAMAAHAIYKLIYPNRPIHFEHSTTKIKE